MQGQSKIVDILLCDVASNLKSKITFHMVSFGSYFNKQDNKIK